MNSTATKTERAIPEDWAVVYLGFLIIFLALVGVVIQAPSLTWNNGGELVDNVFSAQNVLRVLVQFGFMFGIALLGILLGRKPLKHHLYVFPSVFLLTLIALIIAESSQVRALNLEAVIISLSVGLLVSNFFRLPEWFRSALSSEFFVKIGLVLLGARVIFGDILQAGSLGLVQALVVVIAVWYFAFWVCRRLKVDSELTMMICSAVSICGVSAAIATAGAIKGDARKLSYVISLVLITAIPMMIIMPYAAEAMGLSQEVTGAWLGGTIDTTGAVVASGSLVGDVALQYSTIVKFSQNVLLGLAAFAISIYWTYAKKSEGGQVEKPTLRLVWDRFPKFVIGFIATSMLFSFVLSPSVTSSISGSLKSIQGLWFALAFTSIGLETKFSDIFNANSTRPLYSFLIAQAFNIILTLGIAYALFSSV